MHKKMASLWRSLRTPVLLTSATVLIIGCASQNPLMDEAAPSDTMKSASLPSEETVTEEKAITSPPEKVPTETTDRKLEKPVAENESELNSRPTGVKKWLSFFTPYRVNVQQGNFISSEMLAKIQPGMTKEQVRFVLGTPLLTDMFHANRWDYLFRLQKTNGAITTNRVTVFFKENVVERVSNDHLPGEAEYLSHISSDDDPADTPVKASSGEKTKQETSSVKTASDGTEEAGTSSATTETAEPANTSEPVIAPEPDGDSDPASSPEPANMPEPVAVPESARVPEPVRPPEPVSISEPVNTTEVVSTTEPVIAPEADSTSEAVNTPEPAEVQEPVNTPESVMTSESANATESVSVPEQTNHLKSPAVQATPSTERYADIENRESTASEHIGTFEPISIPRRVGKMRSVSPNDQLIGNIQ